MKNNYKLHSIAYQKYKLTVDETEGFKESLNRLIGAINSHDSSEEHNKNIVNKFLKDNLYIEDRYEINTHNRIDAGIIDNSKLKVIIEYKSTNNTSQMPTVDNLNKIALAEAMLYYMREKDIGNDDITNIIITNSYEWFVFDSIEFRRLFYDNPRIKKVFNDKDKNSTTDNNSTKSIYDEFIKINKSEKLLENIKYSYFDIREINTNKEYEKLYKLLSPTNLLKLSFANDANTLNKKFYHELLHIIGLEETKVKSQKLIGRKSLENRENGSLLENTILKLESEFEIDDNEKLFDIALELNITWLNRILFLKLLEGKLIEIDPSMKKFLIYSDPIEGFDVLNTLFFEVLAKPINDRASVMIKDIVNIPYINSSLFEVTALERKYLRISNLKDNLELSIKPNSNLKNNSNYKSNKQIKSLEYLLGFLDTYDFGSGGDKEKSNTRKDLINSAVLGLIFEKLNGYKDGSFFTPSFITEYMSRESIRKSLLDKFATSFDTTFDDFKSLERYSNKNNHNTSFINKANSIIDSITICDPAVGSGHFLVSALNELLFIKSQLGLIFDSEYRLEIENDELYLINQHTSEEISYTLADKKSHKLQKILFEQKRNIIENQLFGVDINSKSTQITRLRLWIELLKSSYYNENNELTTLPNIDINIKTGNSLISRFDTQTNSNDTKLPKRLISKYKKAVKEYKETDNKKLKKSITDTIEEIKASFSKKLEYNSPEVEKFREILYGNGKKLKGYIEKYDFRGLNNEIIRRVSNIEDTLYKNRTKKSLFGDGLELSKAQEKIREKSQKAELKILLKKYEAIKELESSAIYKDSFEWRFEFPEILDEDGKFIGFDIIIGNPPYLPLEIYSNIEKKFFASKYVNLERKYDSSVMFIEEAFNLLRPNGLLSYIAPITFQTGSNYIKFRKNFLNQYSLLQIINLPFNIFEDAFVDTAIYIFKKNKSNKYKIFNFDKKAKTIELNDLNFETIYLKGIDIHDYKLIQNKNIYQIQKQINKSNMCKFGDISISTQGLSASSFSDDNDGDLYPYLNMGNVFNYRLKIIETYMTNMDKHSNLKRFYNQDEKILIRRIINRQDRLTVGFTSEKLVFKKDINPFIITDSSFKIKYVLAIIASRLISWIYINISSTALKNDFRQTTLTELRNLQIPIISLNAQKPFINLVNKILKAKKENKDTTKEEKEIDNMVYKLYGLSDDEVAIVES
ncbi:MAG: Eco57I restriction-modification methylase domain-containing protein [Sulfurovum sp.]